MSPVPPLSPLRLVYCAPQTDRGQGSGTRSVLTPVCASSCWGAPSESPWLSELPRGQTLLTLGLELPTCAVETWKPGEGASRGALAVRQGQTGSNPLSVPGPPTTPPAEQTLVNEAAGEGVNGRLLPRLASRPVVPGVRPASAALTRDPHRDARPTSPAALAARSLRGLLSLPRLCPAAAWALISK